MMDIGKSDAFYDFYCEFCKDQDLNAEADGFCIDCDVYLCGNCLTNHRRNRASRHHVLKDKQAMPRNTPISKNRIRTDISTKCTEHENELVRFYCKAHDFLMCSLCVAQSDHQCTLVDIIKESSSINESREFKDLLHELRSPVTDKIRDIRNHASAHIEKSDRFCSDAETAFVLFRKEIDTMLDGITNNMLQQVESTRTSDEKKIEYIESKCKSLQADIDQLIAEFEELESANRVCQTYIRIKEVEKEVKNIERKLQETEENNKVATYTFLPNLKLKVYLRDRGAFGTLSLQDDSDNSDQSDVNSDG